MADVFNIIRTKVSDFVAHCTSAMSLMVPTLIFFKNQNTNLVQILYGQPAKTTVYLFVEPGHHPPYKIV